MPNPEFDPNFDDFPTESDSADAAEAGRDPLDDAGRIAARAMIGGLMETSPHIVDAARAPGAVVVLISPASEWSEDLGAAWQPLVLKRVAVAPHRDRWRKSKDLYVLLPSGDRSSIGKQDDDRNLAEAVTDGRGALLVVHDLDALTATERAAADLIIRVPRITAGQFRAAAEKIGTGGLSSSDTAMPVTATPSALRLSMRPDQSAEAFVGRVTAFTAAVDRHRSPGRQMPVVPGLDGLFGMDAAVSWGRGLAKDVRAYVNGELDWSSVAPGCLLSGPPGCGKTVFAYRLAAECGVPIIVTSYSEWQSAGQQGHLGELMKCLRGRFAEARRLAPSILFVDEIDTVQSRGAGGSADTQSWFTAIINGMLAEFGNPLSLVGVVVVAASNYAERVDPALRRAGRLDTEIKISLPDIKELGMILRGQLDGHLDGVDLSPTALRLVGGTGADCERAVRGARQRARHAGRPIEIGDLMAEVGGKASASPPSRRTAIHEASHAVVVAATRPDDIVALSIQRDGGILGGTLLKVRADNGSTADDIATMLRELLAGRAAEELFFGHVSGGSGGSPDSDLARATTLAVSCEVTWGLGKSLAWFGDMTPDECGRFISVRPDVASRVEARLAAAYAETLAMLSVRQPAVEALADALLERQVLSGDDVRAMLASVAEMSGKAWIVGKRTRPEDATRNQLGPSTYR